MKEVFVMDACALIAFLNNEDGADKTEHILRRARRADCIIYLNKLNFLEIYYGVFRESGYKKAEEVFEKILSLPLVIIDKLGDDVFKEAGRLKATYKISLADSIVLSEAKIKGAQVLTTDHHEFDFVEKKEKIGFCWIR